MKKNFREKPGKIRLTKDQLVLQAISYPLVILLSLVCFLPFWFIISASFTDNSSILVDGYHLIPKIWSLDAYRYLFASPKTILEAYKVSILVTVAGTVLGVFLMTMAGYVLNRRDVKYRGALSLFIYFTTLFSGGLVPTYLLFVTVLGLRNNLLSLILSGLMTPFYIILMRNFMKSIPDALIEAASIDGAGDFLIFRAVVVPLSGPGIATIALFVSLGYWNNWYSPMLYLSKARLFPLQYYLYNIITAAQTAQVSSTVSVNIKFPSEAVKMAMAVVATGPILMVYPFVQRFFVRGITVGSVKG